MTTIPTHLLDLSRQIRLAKQERRMERFTWLNDSMALFQAHGLMIRADGDMRGFSAFDHLGNAIVTVRVEES